MKKNLLFDVILPRIEGIGYFTSLLGFALKWVMQPGGDILLLVGLGTLSTAYFLRTFAPAKGPAENALSSAVSGQLPQPQAMPAALADNALRVASLGASIVAVGTLFKLLSWSGAAVQLLLGTVMLGLAVLLLALAKQLPLKLALLLVLGVGILAVPPETLIRQFHRNDPVLTQLLLYRLHHPRDRAASEAVRQYLRAQRKPQ